MIEKKKEEVKEKTKRERKDDLIHRDLLKMASRNIPRELRKKDSRIAGEIERKKESIFHPKIQTRIPLSFIGAAKS